MILRPRWLSLDVLFQGLRTRCKIRRNFARNYISAIDFLKSPSFLISGSGGRPARYFGVSRAVIALPKKKKTLSPTCGQVYLSNCPLLTEFHYSKSDDKILQSFSSEKARFTPTGAFG